MRVLTKSLLAITAATALLLGGGGTAALWNDDTSVHLGSRITAGELALSAPAPGVWKDRTGDTIDLNGYFIAPGDVLTYAITLQVTAHGENLRGEIALDPASISPVDAEAAEDVALAAVLVESASYTIDGVEGTTFSTGSGTQDLQVTVTIVWPDAGPDAIDDSAMHGQVRMSELIVTATQLLV